MLSYLLITDTANSETMSSPRRDSSPGTVHEAPMYRDLIISKLDLLRFPTGDTEKDLVASKSPTGCILTVLIPCLVAAYFTFQYVQNSASPNVSTSTIVDLNAFAPISVTMSCSTGSGSGADPVCPTNDFPSGSMGFQFVDRLQTSNASCMSLTRRSRSQAARGWPANNPRGLLDAYIALDSAAAGQQPAASPLPPVTYGRLLATFGIRLDDLWSGAGLPLQASDTANSWATVAQALPSTSLLNPRASVTSNVAAGAVQDRGPNSTLDQAASFGPFPVCAFPRIQASKTVEASRPAAGVGFVSPLLPGYNWNQPPLAKRELLIDLGSLGGGMLRVPIVPPTASATGDELHDLWVSACVYPLRKGSILIHWAYTMSLAHFGSPHFLSSTAVSTMLRRVSISWNIALIL